MEHTYTREVLLSTAYTDRRCELGVYHAVLLLQDGMTEFFHQLNCDALRLSRTHGVLWAVARSKIRYDRMPRWMDTVRLRVFPTKITPITIHINALVETLEGDPLVRCRQELCAIRAGDHSLCRVDDTPFPLDLPITPPVLRDPYCRKKLALGPEALVARHTIRTTDTDMNCHMNNVSYVRLLQNAFPTTFWDRYIVRDFDIHYVSEGREGEELQVYQQKEGDSLDCVIKAGERTLIKAYFTLEDETT